MALAWGGSFKCYIEVSLTSKYNYHLRKAIPLREHFLTVLSIGK